MDRGQRCGSVRGGMEDGIHPSILSRLLSQLSRLPASSFVKLCKILFAAFLALRSPTLDGPTVDRRATNRARHFI